ncbi:Myb 1-like protein [Giardia duodenalis]|uniref:Myb 1-like protein n=1 Tax=Giardia intestinalis (strain ATCC 50803 / WB clone C6) TaxID=184922 RepID=A8BKJ0_GIAIC|nr:Myb 1-like protein [Giardia intestinalis]KAE8301481.1 Myb 1-like protein [Giardia intestinalis]|eukprot:XP_001706539.1 Myb 1-like protein [Giardia lamblia ATCC 50803]
MSLEEVRWRKEDDIMLEQAVNRYGVHKWGAISSLLVGRSPQECRERWAHVLQYKRTVSVVTDNELLRLYRLFGDAWDVIGNATLSSPAVCKSRVYSLLGLESSSDDSSTVPSAHVTDYATVDAENVHGSIAISSSALRQSDRVQAECLCAKSCTDLAATRQREYTAYLKHRPKKRTAKDTHCSHSKRASSTGVAATAKDYRQYICSYIRRNRIQLDVPLQPNRGTLDGPQVATKLVSNSQEAHSPPLSLYPIYAKMNRTKLYTAI